MPIINPPQPLNTPHAKVAIWHITEEEKQLSEMCMQQGITLSNLSTMHLAKRRIEAMIEHLLIKHLLKKVEIIRHHHSGAPYLENSCYNISISHCKKYVTVALSMLNIGIDIESISPQVLRVRSKFLNEHETDAIDDQDIVANTAAWTAKEALYKAIGMEGINFSHDILIDAKALAKEKTSYVCHFRNRIFNATTYVSDDFATTLAIEHNSK